MNSEQRLEGSGVELTVQRVDRVRAEEADPLAPEQLLPVLLQPDGTGPLAGIPKQADHLAEGADPDTAGPLPQLPNGSKDHILEALLVGLSVNQEASQGGSGVQKEQTALSHRRRQIDAVLHEANAESLEVIWSRDNDYSILTPEAVEYVAAHVADQ
jgi:hypothetical protein